MARAKDKVCLGMIAGAHGVRGELRVQSFTARPADLMAYGPLTDEQGRRRFALTVVGETRGQLIVRAESVADRNAAEALKGVRLYVERSALPEPAADEYYHSDLLGLRAELPDGSGFGVVRALYDFGAGDVIEVERPSGERVLLPFNRAVVPVIDLEAGRLVVQPPVETAAGGETARAAGGQP